LAIAGLGATYHPAIASTKSDQTSAKIKFKIELLTIAGLEITYHPAIASTKFNQTSAKIKFKIELLAIASSGTSVIG